MQLCRVLLLLAINVCVLSTPALALPLTIESLRLSSQGDSVLFDMVFDRMPDFTTVDAFGRQADAFQFHIWYDDKVPHLNAIYQTVIRGTEINIAGDIPVRQVSATDPGGPGSGGWGPAVGRVGYEIVPTGGGYRLSFLVPYLMIGDPDRNFAWNLSLYEFGAGYGTPLEFALGRFVDGQNLPGYQSPPVGVPAPGTLPLICVGAGLAVMYRSRRTRS
jgi:hypothetical protein